MELLFKAESIIERDSLLAALKDAGIEALSPARDTSRKMADTTVDLSLLGYSALFDGFQIFVRAEDREDAQDILNQFLRGSREIDSATPGSEDYWRRYYACSLFSVPFPILMNIFALYYLLRALQSRTSPRPLAFLGSSLCFVLSLGFSVFVCKSVFETYFLKLL